jgi:hypothetical protein
MNYFNPSWQEVWTAEEAEKELTGFKFRGPGLYFIGDDVIIVIPKDAHPSISPWETISHPWNYSGWPKHALFTFLVYTGYNPLQTFNLIVSAPIRQDTRS